MRKDQEKKKKITTGLIRLWRFPMLFVSVFMASEAFRYEGEFNGFLIALLILTGLSYLLWKRRRLKHDSKNLYIKRGREETCVPLSDIVSIKRSRTKVNGMRYWTLIYLDEIKQERKLRFNSYFNKEFFNAVRENNPKVVIWEHPFFNH